MHLLLTAAMAEVKSGSRVWCRQKNTRHAEAACETEGAWSPVARNYYISAPLAGQPAPSRIISVLPWTR